MGHYLSIEAKRRHHALSLLQPSRYIQGKNATAVLGTEMFGMGLNGPAFIAASRSPIRLLSETGKHTLGEAGIAYAVYEFCGECSMA